MSDGSMEKSKLKKEEVAERDLKKTVPKNISAASAKRLSEIKKEINSKPFGRSIRDSEILEFALNQLTEEHFQILRETTLSATDYLRIRHEEYQAANGSLTLDDFVRQLVSAKI